jgi:hypothetical protein
MNTPVRILLFFVLPIIAVLAWPPDYLIGLPGATLAAAVLIAAVGVFVLLGRSAALTLAIFLMGLNTIVRVMMFFPHFTTNSGALDWTFVIASIISIALSMWVLLRLDRPDVRVLMVS